MKTSHFISILFLMQAVSTPLVFGSIIEKSHINLRMLCFTDKKHCYTSCYILNVAY